MRVRTLGELTFACGDRVVEAGALRTRSAAQVLAVLVTAAGNRVRLDDLEERVFRPDDGDEIPINSPVPKSLHAIRVAFGELGDCGDGRTPEERVVLRNGIVSFRLPPDSVIDAHVFRDRARAALATGDPAAIHAALALWSGEYLPFSADRAVALARFGYAQLRRDLFWRLVEIEPDAAETLALMRVLSRTYPEDQRLTEYAMRIALRAGERIAAVETFGQHRDACAARGLPVDDDVRALGEYLERSTFGSGSVPASAKGIRGRDETLVAIERRIAGRATSALVLSAPPGAGLTTLLRELVVRARARGGVAAYARCDDPQRPDVALHDLVRGLTRALSVTIKVRDGLVPPDTVVHHADVEAALASLRRTLAYVRGHGGDILIALDEADRVVAAVVEAITAACAGNGAGVVFGTHHDALAGADRIETRIIPPLDASTIRAIVEDRLGARVGDRFAELLVALWPGNVRVVLAAAKHMSESGIARRTGGTFEIPPETSLVACIPERIHAMVSRRADGLADEAYAVAVALAVLAIDVPHDRLSTAALAGLLGIDDRRAQAALDELTRRRLLLDGRRMPLAAAAYFAQYCSAARRRSYQRLLSTRSATAARSGSATN